MRCGSSHYLSKLPSHPLAVVRESLTWEQFTQYPFLSRLEQILTIRQTTHRPQYPFSAFRKCTKSLLGFHEDKIDGVYRTLQSHSSEDRAFVTRCILLFLDLCMNSALSLSLSSFQISNPKLCVNMSLELLVYERVYRGEVVGICFDAKQICCSIQLRCTRIKLPD